MPSGVNQQQNNRRGTSFHCRGSQQTPNPLTSAPVPCLVQKRVRVSLSISDVMHIWCINLRVIKSVNSDLSSVLFHSVVNVCVCNVLHFSHHLNWPVLVEWWWKLQVFWLVMLEVALCSFVSYSWLFVSAQRRLLQLLSKLSWLRPWGPLRTEIRQEGLQKRPPLIKQYCAPAALQDYWVISCILLVDTGYQGWTGKRPNGADKHQPRRPGLLRPLHHPADLCPSACSAV